MPGPDMMFPWLSGAKGSRAHGGRSRARLCIEALESRNLLDAGTLLISTWNVGIADAGRRLGSYETVLAAIGQESYYAAPRPPDILSITETRGNARTGADADTGVPTGRQHDPYR